MDIYDYTDTLGAMYDTDSILIDYENNNFDLDMPNPEPYYKPAIVAESWINGQLKQARDQFSAYGLTADMLKHYLDSDQILKLID